MFTGGHAVDGGTWFLELRKLVLYLVTQNSEFMY